jgi:hypothetical protein
MYRKSPEKLNFFDFTKLVIRIYLINFQFLNKSENGALHLFQA